MKFECVTSMNSKYYNQVGYKMLSSWLDKWPKDINLRVYHEDSLINGNAKNLSYHNLFKEEPECEAFVERHKDRPDQQNSLELHKGAVRFSYKTFSILNAGITSNADYLIWVDADTFTHTKVTHDFLNELVEENKYLTYLGRGNNYSECGFVIYNLNHPVHNVFFETWRHLYESDEVFKLEQWHDSFVWDQIRLTYEKNNVIENINLSPWGKDYEHVFINSILGEYMDHMKGPRKNEGKSRKQDLFLSKDNEYWH